MKIYIIGSLKNPIITKIGNLIRAAGHEAFDCWFAGGPEADDYWQKYCKDRGQTYHEALNDVYARHIYDFDKQHLDSSDAGIIVQPAGKSAHWEAGYLRGQRKPVFVFLPGEPERYEVMNLFATAVVKTEDELLKEIRKLT